MWFTGSLIFLIYLQILALRLLKGRTIPGKILLTRRADPIDDLGSQENSPNYRRSYSSNDAGTSDRIDKAVRVLHRYMYMYLLFVYLMNS